MKIRFMVALGAVALAATACGGEGFEDETGEVQEAQSIYDFYMTSDGVLHSYLGSPDWTKVTSATVVRALNGNQTFLNNHPHRSAIVKSGDAQNAQALCGDAARAVYKYDKGANWCTEYARWLFRGPGEAPNVSYCHVDALVCWDYIYLSEVEKVSEMVNMFKEYGGWVSEGNIKSTTPVPGDYVGLVGSSGDKLTHSGVVMAVSSDGRYMFTSEGNVGDCVSFKVRPFFTNGVLSSKINGIGKLQAFY